MGFSILTGTLLIPNSLRVNAISIRSSSVSPNPIMPPLHTLSPAAFAALTAFTLSSNVWVVQTFGKFLREVSRLLCILDTPASFTLQYCPSSRSPKDAHTLMSVCSRISRIASHICSISASFSDLPEVTIENLCTPWSALYFA